MATERQRGSRSSAGGVVQLPFPEGCKGVQLFKKGSKLDDMVACLDDSKVLFGVVKTGLDDAGSFSRKSTLFVVYKGESLGQVKSSKIMAHKFAIQAFCESYGKLTSQVNCYDKSNMKELIKAEIEQYTIDDSKDIGDLDYSLGDTKATPTSSKVECRRYEVDLNGDAYGMCVCGMPRARHSKEALAEAAAVAASPSKPASMADEEPAVVPPAGKGYSGDEPLAAPPSLPEEASKSRIMFLKREASLNTSDTEYGKACKDGSPPSAEEVLEIVRDMHGTPYNWVLLKPNKDKLVVEDAGGGGVVELSGLLERSASDKLLYGLVRIAFGLGKLRRAWLFSVHWQGQNCSGVKVMMQKRECAAIMEEKMGDNSFTVDAIGPDDVMPEAVIAKLSSSVVIDGNSHDLSVAALVDALEDEQKQIKEYHANKEKKKREAEELEKQRLEAEANRAEAEAQDKERAAEAQRLAKEAAEKERQEKEEQERLEKQRIAAEAFAAAREGVPGCLQEVDESDEDAWVLFEVVL